MGARILVADDSVTIQKVVELTFSKEDFVLIQARSGEEAIRKAAEARPDLVLLDLVMPDKNGYEVCAALRADPTLRAVPIILLAGSFEAFDKEQGLRAGANDFVTKPFESQVLIGKVKQLLFAKTMGEEPPVAAGPGLVQPTPGIEQFLKTTTSTPPPVAPPPRAVAAPVPPMQAAPPPTSPPASEPSFELPPPTEEISQDRLWQLLDSTPSRPSPGGPGESGELRLEDLTAGPTPPAQVPLLELPPLEVPSLDLDLLQPSPAEDGKPEAPSVQGPELEVAPLPESLSLEDLLSTPGAPPPATPTIQPLPEEPAVAEPVFDLSPEMDAPLLPMTEVRAEQPPPISIEDLLGLPETAPSAPGEAGLVGLPDLELGSIPEGLQEDVFSLADAPAAEPPSGPDIPLDMSLPGLELTAHDTGSLETLEPAEPPVMGEWAAEATASPAPAEMDLLSGLEAMATPSPVSMPQAAAAPPVVSETEAPAPAIEAAIPTTLEVAPAHLASLRQEVTERVARDLAQELSQKLLERIERIVWEVVPDLAEVLITKEIERIRAMAEDKQPS